MKRPLLLLFATLVLLAAASLVSAQTGDWDLSWSTIDSGGGTSRGGDRFTIAGTAGQADAATLIGGVYALHGGFWGLSDANALRVYLPLIVK